MIDIKSLARCAAVMLTLALLAACGEAEKSGEHGHEAEEGSARGEERGPHGGKLLRKDDFAVEVKIYEEGVPPEFRLYAYDDDKPVDVRELKATIEVRRLDRTDVVRFAPRGDYLLGDREIVEPHSFDVVVNVQRRGTPYRFTYSQLEGRTQLSPEQAREAGIVVETAGPARMKSILELPGEIALNADRTAHLVSRVPGVVTRVGKNLGDAVRRGETLAVVESGDVAAARSEYLAAVRRRELTRTTAQREEELFKKKISSQEEYLRARNAWEEATINVRTAEQKLSAMGLTPSTEGGQLASLPLRSPLTGSVIAKDVTVGESVGPADVLFTVADLSSVWVDITVPAQSVAALRPGQKVRVHVPSTGQHADGNVSYVGPVVGGENRSAKARVVLPNRGGSWRPGLFVNVQLETAEMIVPVAVRAESLQTFRDWNVVFIQVGNQYEVRPLELGRRDEEWVEVTAGLEPGQKYVAKNSFILKADVLKAGASHDH